MIFSRKGGNAGRHTEDGLRRRGRDTVDPLDETPDESDAGQRDFGPWDLAEAPEDDQERLDLGALRIPAIAGVEIQLQAGQDGQVQQVMLVHDENRLQLGVFAAPRTEGIWDEVRAMLRTSMAQSGARQEDTAGDYGPELKARLRDGASTVDLRHLGVDGPRWFVHAVYIGEAAADPSKAGPLRDVLRGLVVDRGTEARPVREPLPLRLPPQAAAQLAAQANAAQEETAEAGQANGRATATPAKPAPPKPAPAKAGLAKAAPAKAAPAKAGLAKAAPAKAAPKAAPAKAAPTKTAPADAGADSAEPTSANVQRGTGRSGSTRGRTSGRGASRQA